MSTDGRGTKCRRNIAENFNRLIEQGARALQTDRQTDRQTDGRAIAYSEREHEFTFAKNCMLLVNKERFYFLANVNLRSPSLYAAPVRLSVCLSVCLSATLVHPARSGG